MFLTAQALSKSENVSLDLPLRIAITNYSCRLYHYLKFKYANILAVSLSDIRLAHFITPDSDCPPAQAHTIPVPSKQ